MAGCDFNADGTDDIIVSPGLGKRAEVRVFNVVTGLPFPAPLGSFLAFESGFLGGVHLACGDLTGDSIPDIIAARGALARPEVRVFNGVTAAPLPPPFGSFLAFNQTVFGGVRVAGCDLNQDGRTDIVAARGPLAQPEIRAFDGLTGNIFPPPLGSFLAFSASDRGGVYVACGDLTGDTIPDIIAGKGLGQPPTVRVFNGVTAAPLPPPFGSFQAFNSTFPGGVRVGSCDLNQDGRNDIIAGRGPGAQPEVRAFDGVSGAPFPGPMGSFLAFAPTFKGGVYLACSPNDSGPVVQADLAVTKTDSPDPVQVGSNLTYTVTVTNNGPSNATGVIMSDDLPGGVSFVSATPSQGSCAGATIVDCDLGSLAASTSATVTLTVTPTAPGTLTNTASVDGNEADPTPANDSDTEQTTVTPAPVLQCDGLTPTIVGTPGNNTLTGTDGNDVIHGLGGDDILNGVNGNDVICGGDGTDLLNGDGGIDRLFGENGNDILNGNDGDDALDGGAESDTCNGGNGSDTATSCESVTNVP